MKLFKLMLLHHNVGCFASTVMCIRCTFLISSILCQQQQQKKGLHIKHHEHILPPLHCVYSLMEKHHFFSVHVRQCDYAQFYGEKIFLLVTGEKALGGAAVMAQSNGKVFNVAVCGILQDKLNSSAAASWSNFSFRNIFINIYKNISTLPLPKHAHF